MQNGFIGTEHLLLGLVKLDQGTACEILRKAGVELEDARRLVENRVSTSPEGDPNLGKPIQTPRTKKVLALALRQARNFNHKYVGTEHLLLGMLEEKSGLAARVLLELGVELKQVQMEIRKSIDPNYQVASLAAVTDILEQQISLESDAGKASVKFMDLDYISIKVGVRSLEVEPRLAACLIALSGRKDVISTKSLLELISFLEDTGK